MQKLILAISLLIFLQIPIQLFSQDVIEGVLIVNALNDDAKPTDSRMGKPSAWAANILKFADTLTYTEQYILPDESLKRGEVQRRSRYDRPVENSSLKLYPNPAREYVIIEYALEGDGTGYMIKLADANGFLRQTIKPEANRGFVVIDTRRLETGTYIAIVSKDGKFVGTGKFIVVN